MHLVCVQIQPNLLTTFDEHAIEALRAIDAPEIENVETNRGQNDGPYINVIYTTSNPRLLWSSVREELIRLGLQGAAIVTCTGTRGWDNYLLLHHFSCEVPNARFGAY